MPKDSQNICDELKSTVVCCETTVQKLGQCLFPGIREKNLVTPTAFTFRWLKLYICSHDFCQLLRQVDTIKKAPTLVPFVICPASRAKFHVC